MEHCMHTFKTQNDDVSNSEGNIRISIYSDRSETEYMHCIIQLLRTSDFRI